MNLIIMLDMTCTYLHLCRLPNERGESSQMKINQRGINIGFCGMWSQPWVSHCYERDCFSRTVFFAIPCYICPDISKVFEKTRRRKIGREVLVRWPDANHPNTHSHVHSHAFTIHYKHAIKIAKETGKIYIFTVEQMMFVAYLQKAMLSHLPQSIIL